MSTYVSRLKFCVICGRPISDGQEPIGGKMKRGFAWAHKKCWVAEQAERAKASGAKVAPHD